MTATVVQPAKVRAEPVVPTWAMPAAVLAGIVFRVVQYAWDRSFWHDEASLVLNIRNKSAAELLGPLDYHQAAPPLFLLLERGIDHVFGGSELSLRLLPLVLGCAAVVLFATVARRLLPGRLLPGWAAVATVLLFACSERLVWHSVEAKQYGADVFASTMLLALAVGSAHPASVARGLLALCAAAAVLVWLSYPAVLVFAGISLALLPASLRQGSRTMAAWIIGNVLVGVSFLALLHLSVHAQASGSLSDYWAEDFIDLRHPLALPLWLARRVLALCNYPIEGAGPLVLICAAAGIINLARGAKIPPKGRSAPALKSGQLLGILLLPLAMNLLAAAAQRYPFDGARLTVYLAPMVLLLAGCGISAIASEWAHGRLARWVILPVHALVLWAAAVATYHLVVPQWRGHVRPIAKFVRAHLQPGDRIYALELREFQCYWRSDARLSSEIPAADEIPSRRFWIVWSFPNPRSFHRLDGTLAWAKSFATLRLQDVGPGAAAFLFEKSGAAPHAPPPDMSTRHKMMARDRD